MLFWVSASPKLIIGAKKHYENGHVPLPLMYVKELYWPFSTDSYLICYYNFVVLIVKTKYVAM